MSNHVKRNTISIIENGRAAYAFAQVKAYIDKSNTESAAEYRSYIKKLPAMIQVNGYAQAMAFCYAKGKAYRTIYDQVSNWLQQQHGGILRRTDPTGNQEFIETIVNMDSSDYRVLAAESIVLLQWMSRFVDGMVKSQ